MPVQVGDQHGAAGRVEQLGQGIELFRMELVDVVEFVIDGPVTGLRECLLNV